MISVLFFLLWRSFLRGSTFFSAYVYDGLGRISRRTINTANRMKNQINGIRPANRSLNTYMEAGRGVAKYIENQVTNEMLYWTGR